MFRPRAYELAKRLAKVKTETIFDKYFDSYVGSKAQNSDRLLDIGSADGETTVETVLKRFRGQKTTILGVDKSPLMVDYSVERYKDNRRADFKLLDIETNRLPDDLIGKFDHVFALFLFHWLEDHELALKNVYQLMRPGGTFFTVSFTRHAFFQAFKRLKSDEKWSAYAYDLPVPVFLDMNAPDVYMRELFAKTGFEVFVCDPWDTSYVCDYEEYRDLALAVNPALKRLPETAWSEYIDDCLREYFNSGLTKNDHGTITDNFTLLTVVAGKPEH